MQTMIHVVYSISAFREASSFRPVPQLAVRLLVGSNSRNVNGTSNDRTASTDSTGFWQYVCTG